ncbi:MAG: ABC transporter substrate-binding protein [Acidimicrobiia bacterium]
MDEPRDRREFLRLAAGAVATGAVAACSSGSGQRETSVATRTKGSTGQTLRIAQFSHYIPAYDTWFDNEYTQRWGDEHGVEVLVDHVPFQHLRSRAEAEVAAGRGHDIFALLTPPAGLADEVIDHRPLVEEVVGRVGPMTPLVERSVLNTKTGKYFAFPDFWGPNVTHYRNDVWTGPGPDSWEAVLGAAPGLKSAGHPVGLAFSPDHDSTMGFLSLMFAHGATIQDESGTLAINRPATVEVVERAAALFAEGLTDDVLNWDAASDNRFLASGKGSWILDPISAMRATEQQDAALAGQIALAPVPAGPAARIGATALLNSYVVMKSSSNQELAGQFLVDLAVGYREAFIHSEFYNLPAFAGAVGDIEALLAADPATPARKYGVLAASAEWTTNIGHPGHDNAAVEEIFNRFLIPRMFTAAATGELSAAEAVRAAEADMAPIYQKWRDLGRL